MLIFYTLSYEPQRNKWCLIRHVSVAELGSGATLGGRQGTNNPSQPVPPPWLPSTPEGQCRGRQLEGQLSLGSNLKHRKEIRDGPNPSLLQHLLQGNHKQMSLSLRAFATKVETVTATPHRTIVRIKRHIVNKMPGDSAQRMLKAQWIETIPISITLWFLGLFSLAIPRLFLITMTLQTIS